MKTKLKKGLVILMVIIVAAAGGFFAWKMWKPSYKGLVSGNGRIQATEVDVATKLAGRVIDIFVDEGDFVKSGELLVQMQVDVLEAQRREAEAHKQKEINTKASKEAEVALKESEKTAAEAEVAQRESELDAAQRRLARSETLSQEGALSVQEFDDDRAKQTGAKAAVAAAESQVTAKAAAIKAAESEVVGAQSAVQASDASIARVEADIEDSQIKSPIDGRVQYRVAQPGEVLGEGGKVLNLVDLGDVYMTFFLPTEAAGKVALGSEVRIILDAAPQYVIPAEVSYVASTAQFTPKTVETASERQKLMFRIKGQIDRNLLQKHLRVVKTGLPGVAWIKTDANAQWPKNLEVKVPE